MYYRWQDERNQLNHNWLQNGVLVALNHALSVVSGNVRCSSARRTLTEDVARWTERSGDMPGFLDRCENEMSPRALFRIVPLCRCSDETKRWLEPLIHERWLEREQIHEKIFRAKSYYASAEHHYGILLALLRGLSNSPDDDISSCLKALHDFTGECQNLSNAISALPHEIMP